MVLMGLAFLGSLIATIAILVLLKVAFMGVRPDGPKLADAPAENELSTQPDKPIAESQPGNTMAHPAKPAPIRNPAEAVAALEAGDKEVAARGVAGCCERRSRPRTTAT